MDTVKVNKNGCKMVAHRGLSGIERENTCAAFVAAGNRSYYAVETDVRKTSDGHFVVAHDHNLKRVGSSSLVISESTLAMVQSVRLREKGRDTKDRGDLHVPTLVEYVRICKTYEKICVLELKDDYTVEDLSRVIDIINGEDYLDNVIFISFSWISLVNLRKLLPSQPAQFLCSVLDEAKQKEVLDNNFDLDIHYKGLTDSIVDAFHKAGRVVNVWTVDDKENCEKLIAMGVDFITTNICE